MRFCTIFPGIFIAAFLFLSVPAGSAGESPGTESNLKIQALERAVQKIDKRLSDMQPHLQSLAHPIWEYKVVVPNIINTSGMDDQGIDGVNLSELGKQGWELVNYTVSYGFIFKRRQIRK